MPVRLVVAFKFVRFFDNGIGHLAGNTEAFFRRLQLNIISNKIYYIGLIGKKPANEQLLKMYKRLIPIYSVPQFFLDFFHSRSLFFHSFLCQQLPGDSNDYYEYDLGRTTISFSTDEERQGSILLEKIGVKSKEFVCFHNRDSEYMRRIYKTSYFEYHCYRDAEVRDYFLAMEKINNYGLKVLRMGQYVASPNYNLPKDVIDYTTFYRSDFGDIYVPSQALFFVGTSCGLTAIPAVFQVPIVCVNTIPLCRITPLKKEDIFIPKKIWSIREKRMLSLSEILEHGIGWFLKHEQFQQAGLEVINNTKEEILDVVEEMTLRLQGSFILSEESNLLQKRFKSIFNSFAHRKPFHKTNAHVGSIFLKQNHDWLL